MRFLERILEEYLGHGGGEVELGWGGGFLTGDPFTGFYWKLGSYASAGLQPGAADPVRCAHNPPPYHFSAFFAA